MSFSLVRRGMVLGVTFGLLALTGTASAAKLHGVVVQHNTRAHSLVLAVRRGHLVSVHTHRKLAAGRVVVASVRKLRNGTYAARHIRARHQLRHRVRIHGVVTFVNRRRGQFVVSDGGASLLIKTRRHGARAAGAASATLPSVGDEVTVETQIDDQGDLEDQGVQGDGTAPPNIDLEGTILAIDTTAGTLTVSADDEDQSGASVTVDVPSTFDMSMFSVGQEVELTVSLQPDGTFLLVGSSEDGNAGDANNGDDQQGCQGDEQGDSCSGSSGSGSSSSGDDCQGDEQDTSCSSSSDSGDGDSQGDGQGPSSSGSGSGDDNSQGD